MLKISAQEEFSPSPNSRPKETAQCNQKEETLDVGLSQNDENTQIDIIEVKLDLGDDPKSHTDEKDVEFDLGVVNKDPIVKLDQENEMVEDRDGEAVKDYKVVGGGGQTKYRLYLVLDFVNGGHLFFQLYHHGLFREDLARIYTAEIVSAVSHLHANGIMHRDLKPENILLDANGHAMLADFGLAKEFDENSRSNSMCGTVEYMAPEIILGKGHDKAADWWSVGILLFEMLTGKPPFIGGNREKMQKTIIKDKIKLLAFLSSEAHSLLKGLLQKESSKRLGSGPSGSDEIKHHKWFKSINWIKLDARQIHPSFVPDVAGMHCTSNFEERWTNMSLIDSPASSPRANEDVAFLLRRESLEMGKNPIASKGSPLHGPRIKLIEKSQSFYAETKEHVFESKAAEEHAKLLRTYKLPMSRIIPFPKRTDPASAPMAVASKRSKLRRSLLGIKPPD